jgi:hypothetical protein
VTLLLEFLFLAATAFAHDDHSNVAAEMGGIGPTSTAGLGRPVISPLSSTVQTPPPSYFGHSTGSGFLYTHVFLMVLGWMSILPVGTLSVMASPFGVAAC